MRCFIKASFTILAVLALLNISVNVDNDGRYAVALTSQAYANDENDKEDEDEHGYIEVIVITAPGGGGGGGGGWGGGWGAGWGGWGGWGGGGGGSEPAPEPQSEKVCASGETEQQVTLRYARVLEQLIEADNAWNSYINVEAAVWAAYASSVGGPYAGNAIAAGYKVIMDMSLSYLSGEARDNLRSEYESMMQTCS